MSNDLQTLRGALLHQRWHDECEVIPAYRAEHQKPQEPARCVVRHIPSGRFLRYSAGPQTGTFWDVYGDHFLTEALATVELSKAPAPIMAISKERRREVLELPVHMVDGKKYVAREDLVKAIDGVIFTPLPGRVHGSKEIEADDDHSAGEIIVDRDKWAQLVALEKTVQGGVAVDQIQAVLATLGKFDLPDRIQGGAGRSISYGALCLMRDRLEGALQYLPGEVHGSAGTESGEIEAATIGVTRAGLEPATYGLKGPESNAGETPTDADISGSAGASSGDERRSAPENGSKSPDKSPETSMKPATEAEWRERMRLMLTDPRENCPGPIYLSMALRIRELESKGITVSAPVHAAGWGANSRLREIHVNDGLTLRLNDTQLEARSPGGTWQPLTLSLIPRPYRTALAELLARPVEQDHTPKCRIRSGGPCTCPAGVRA